MKVYMVKDVEKVGMAGQVIKVTDGYAKNFLLPRKLAKVVDKNSEAFFLANAKKIAVEKNVLGSKVAMLAERIKNMHLIVKERVHDDGKLYGSVGADEIVELLKKEKDISVNRKQIEFPKTVKAVGEHKVAVKLTAKLKPEFTLKVVAADK